MHRLVVEQLVLRLEQRWLGQLRDLHRLLLRQVVDARLAVLLRDQSVALLVLFRQTAPLMCHRFRDLAELHLWRLLLQVVLYLLEEQRVSGRRFRFYRE